MASYSSYIHNVEADTGLRTFTVMEHTSDQVMVNGIHTGVMHQWRTVLDTATGEVVREFKPLAGCYSPAPYDATAGEAWLKEKYGKKLHGFAPVPHIPQMGEVADGWTATSARSDGHANSPLIVTWMRRSEISMQTHYRETQGGTVIKSWMENEGMATNYIQSTYSGGNITISTTNSGWINTANIAVPTVPDGASYFDACKYGGFCHECEADIEVGDAIWAWKPENSRWRIWCPEHKQNDPAAKSARVEHDEEHDMAQMMEFRFPYTGTQIAAALEAKAAKIDDQNIPDLKLDVATLKVLHPAYSDEDITDLVKGKQKKVSDQNAVLEKAAAKIRKEAVPFAQAGSTKFELDLEDIAHYGLDTADVPRKAPRKPRKTRDVVLADV